MECISEEETMLLLLLLARQYDLILAPRCKQIVLVSLTQYIVFHFGSF